MLRVVFGRKNVRIRGYNNVDVYSISSFVDVGSYARSAQPHEVENFWL